MDISYMPKPADGYHQLVVARESLSRWAGAQPHKEGTSQKVADVIYEQVIWRFGTPDSVVLDGDAENKRSTDLLLKH